MYKILCCNKLRRQVRVCAQLRIVQKKGTEIFGSLRAIDEARTRDLHLGKVAYYQLYYYRICIDQPFCAVDND